MFSLLCIRHGCVSYDCKVVVAFRNTYVRITILTTTEKLDTSGVHMLCGDIDFTGRCLFLLFLTAFGRWRFRPIIGIPGFSPLELYAIRRATTFGMCLFSHEEADKESIRGVVAGRTPEKRRRITC